MQKGCLIAASIGTSPVFCPANNKPEISSVTWTDLGQPWLCAGPISRDESEQSRVGMRRALLYRTPGSQIAFRKPARTARP
jgi:hypothetical protein